MLEHVDLCEPCARKLFPLLEAPEVHQVDMAYVARVVSACRRCKRHAPAVLAAQRRFQRERGDDDVWTVIEPAPAPALAALQRYQQAEAEEPWITPPLLDWAWVERRR